MDTPSILTPTEQKLLLALAHDAIEAQLENQTAPTWTLFLKKHSPTHESELPEESVLHKHLGAFVSLYVDDKLRGCIGSFQSEVSLWQNVQHMARNAATRDPRFPPLRSEELESLQCEISVLTKPTVISGPDDVVVGRDGLIVEDLTHRGVLLPQVATKYNWNAEEFLQHTCIKASLPPEAWREEETHLAHFQAIVFSDSTFSSDPEFEA